MPNCRSPHAGAGICIEPPQQHQPRYQQRRQRSPAGTQRPSSGQVPDRPDLSFQQRCKTDHVGSASPEDGSAQQGTRGQSFRRAQATHACFTKPHDHVDDRRNSHNRHDCRHHGADHAQLNPTENKGGLGQQGQLTTASGPTPTASYENRAGSSPTERTTRCPGGDRPVRRTRNRRRP